ncbi:MAG: ABC transporter ATP-binding protein, partial [Chloroflexota bacterium]
ILLSTHDLDLALRSADRLWLLPHGGPLHDGAPEDLVLSGALEATFHSEGIAFDRQTGTFAIVAARTGGVALVGAGVTALWTRRALEREGYCVAEEDGEAFARVEVLGGEESPRWRCTVGGIVGEYDSLHALIAALRAAQA